MDTTKSVGITGTSHGHNLVDANISINALTQALFLFSSLLQYFGGIFLAKSDRSHKQTIKTVGKAM